MPTHLADRHPVVPGIAIGQGWAVLDVKEPATSFAPPDQHGDVVRSDDPRRRWVLLGW